MMSQSTVALLDDTHNSGGSNIAPNPTDARGLRLAIQADFDNIVTESSYRLDLKATTAGEDPERGLF